MPGDVLKSWAADAQAEIDRLTAIVNPSGVIYPPEEGRVSDFTVIHLGHGAVKMTACAHDNNRLPGMWFGKGGKGIGDFVDEHRQAEEGETLAVVTFANVQGLDVMLDVLLRCRATHFPEAPASASMKSLASDTLEKAVIKERELAAEAIEGALADGYQGSTQPEKGHWLLAAHKAGARVAELERAAITWKPLPAPKPGAYLVTVATDNGPEVHRLDLNNKGQWIHEGEPTFCKSYYFEPKLYADVQPGHFTETEGDDE